MLDGADINDRFAGDQIPSLLYLPNMDDYDDARSPDLITGTRSVRERDDYRSADPYRDRRRSPGS